MLRLLGKFGTAYVVGTANAQGGHGRIYRVAADGARTLLARAHPFMSILSDDGGTLVTNKVGQTSASTITVYDVATATQKDRAVFGQYGMALDAQTNLIIIGTTSSTKTWTLSSGKVQRVSHDPGYVANLAADVVGTFTKDPYDGGCSEVRRISSKALLWRSCTEQVAAFNADASRIATIGILSDGPGPGRVDARTIDGKALGRYQVRSGWFGSIDFETSTGLLLEVNGARKAFTARCTGTSCERASDLRPAEVLRTSAR
jgi:limonene-1,2-epoxide hydrolase